MCVYRRNVNTKYIYPRNEYMKRLQMHYMHSVHSILQIKYMRIYVAHKYALIKNE